MIHQVIAAYLRTNKRLVIPQFGALIHKESEGTIAFVPFLKKDDGVLTQQVAAAYGIDLGEASAKIEAWVNEIKTQITTVGAYPLEGIGILRLDPNGIYSLMDSVSSSFSTPKGEAVRPQGTPSPSAPPAPSRTISTLDPATQAHSGASPRPYAGQRPEETSNG
ncbi:MAG: hypothetical protein PHV49_05710, partial [Alistipes sp.]|nr:hypothetical protein [Alistipes sp.]